VIKTADRIIDLGPEGGEEGGLLMAAGTPEEVARAAESHTGRYLAEMVGKPRRRRRSKAAGLGGAGGAEAEAERAAA
jgi:excinuclease ABC subunit A